MSDASDCVYVDDVYHSLSLSLISRMLQLQCGDMNDPLIGMCRSLLLSAACVCVMAVLFV